MLETICEVMKHSYDKGMISTRDGNVSLRHADRDHFYVTPSGIRKPVIQYDMFKKLKVDNCDDIYFTDIASGLKSTGELPLHWGLQKNIPTETRVVLHTHPTYIVAAMHAGIQLNELVTNFPELGRYSKVASNVPDVPPISQELADHCFDNLGLQKNGLCYFDIVGIKGHGVVAIDETPWRAFEHIERLEHICKIVLSSGNY
jgi:ribulose-5-phosphate 4-epimerase/fuculose-1-phosphate aldolase